MRNRSPFVLILCIMLASGKAMGAPVLQPLTSGLDGAGCGLRIGDEPREVMTVMFGSIEEDDIGAARVRIAGVNHSLDWTDKAQGHWVFRDKSLTIEVIGATEIEPICGGSECEGSHYKGSLIVTDEDHVARYDVRMHCGV